MTFPAAPSDKVLSIYLALAQYPILRTRIRSRMRRELFDRGVIRPQAFETEVREKGIISQAREGLHNPFREEPADVWGSQPLDGLLLRLQPALRSVRTDRA